MDGARTGNVSHTDAPNVLRSVTEAQNDRGAPNCPGLLRTNLFRLYSSSAPLCMASLTNLSTDILLIRRRDPSLKFHV